MDLTQRTETFAVDDQSWLASRHGTGEGVSVTLDTSAFTKSLHYPDGFFKSGLALGKISATGKYGPYAGQTNEVQTLTVGGSGLTSFTATYSGQTTGAIPANATGAQVQAALTALSNIGDNDVSVAGGAGGPWVVTFKGVLGGTDVAALTTTPTGGTGTVGVSGTTAGGANPGTSDGTETFWGFLAFSVKAPDDPAVDVAGAGWDHCKVKNARLPFPVDSAGRADAAGRIFFY